METVETECVIVGAGVIGLAIARELARHGREVAILESQGAIGTGNSSRNSEVIHAGIYYAPTSLKAKLCVAGRDMLYDYCLANDVAHRRLGKLIVATQEMQLSALDALAEQARRNGVGDLARLSGEQARALEPNLMCLGALHSPSTGIVDSHGLMQALLREAQGAGAMLALRASVIGGRLGAENGVELDVSGQVDMRVKAKWLVNCAGLGAQDLARSIVGLPACAIPPLHLAKGSYFALRGRAPCQRLVYPMPEPGGLGIHLTLDLAGSARFGPDVEWVERVDYTVNSDRMEKFEQSIRRYWPGLPDGALAPAHCGIRPKLSVPGEPNADFSILGPADLGVPGQLHLFGIESPGLTSALAIAQHVSAIVARHP